MTCPKCQANNPCEARFCMNCGTALRVICQNCSFENIHSANYCNQCGHTVHEKSLIYPPEPRAAQQDSIKRFIPEEYAEKLEEARRSQTMKGERRIVSILFCDVKGSTSMAEKLDPEEWAEIMNQAFEYLISPIYTYEGTLARLMGDSVLAFFGAPISHEDDAKRAILAGMKIVKDIQPFTDHINRQYNLDFDVRVGINTGLVVVGGVGSDLFMEYTALGDAINIASRMEQTAEPGTIQIGEDTYKQTKDFFEFELLPDVDIRGKSEKIKAYRVLGLVEESEFHQGDIPLVGRSAELEHFRQTIETVQKGSGQIVCLIGEAGLGKTRLLKEARNIWKANMQPEKPFGQLASRWNQALGLSYESARPYGFIQHLIRNYLGILPDDTAEEVREKISKTLAIVGAGLDDEKINLFELMLGLKDQDSQELSGEGLKRKIYAELLRTLELLTREAPAVIAADDLHWADPASAELLVHLFQLVDHLPILFICSFRPHQNSQAWMVKQAAEVNYMHRYTQINLQPLSRSESNQMILHNLQGIELPEAVQEMILQKSDGNPFFVEEVVRGLQDDHVITFDPNTEKWSVNAKINELSIPETLSAVITARIDRLGESARQVLQLASVIGRTFPYRVLAKINDVSDSLDSELVNLLRTGLIVEVSRDPEIEYSFRQAFTNETAYNTILLKHRRLYHGRVGEAILELYPEQEEKYSPLLGHHFYQAQDSRALKYFKMNGDAAMWIYANPEAIDNYRKAIEVFNWKNETNLEELADLYMRLGRAYELESQFKTALLNYKEFENIAIRLGDLSSEMLALVSQAQIYSVPSSEFSIERGEPAIERAEQIAEELNDRKALAKILWLKMNLYRFSQGLVDAQIVGEKAIELARELNLEEQLAYSLNDANHAYSMNGQVRRAKEVGLEAAELWKKLNNLPMLADAYGGLAAIHVYTGEFDKAYEFSDMAYDISEEINNNWGKAYSRYAIGIVDLERGQLNTAIKRFKQTIHDSKISEFRAGELLTSTFLAVTYAELGAYEEAFKVVNRDYGLELEYLSVTRAFSLGAHLLVQARAGNIEKAEEVMLHFNNKTEGAYFVAKHYYVLGQCYLYLLKGECETARKITFDFIKFLEETGVVYMLPELYMLLGLAYKGLGDISDARSTLSKGLEIAEHLGSRKQIWQLNYHLGVTYRENGDLQNANSYFREAAEILDFIIDQIKDEDLLGEFLNRKDVRNLIELKEQIDL